MNAEQQDHRSAIDRLIATAAAKPATHVVETHYSCGRVRRHETRSIGAAENYAAGERQKIGRALIDRATGGRVRVVAVTVSPIGDGR